MCPNSIAEGLFCSLFSSSLQFSISVSTEHQQRETKKGTKPRKRREHKRWSFVTRWCVLRTRTGAWRLIPCSRSRASKSLLTALVPTWSSRVPRSGSPMSTNSEPPTSICTMTYVEKTLNCILFSLFIRFSFCTFPLFTPKSNPQLVGLLQLEKDSIFSASTFYSHKFSSFQFLSVNLDFCSFLWVWFKWL